jgi:hypothetical protein
MAADQQVMAAWVSAAAAVVQAIGAVAAIVVAIKLARDSERRAIEADRASAAREVAADRAATARAEAADRAAEERIARSFRQQRKGMVDTISTLATELLEDVAKDAANAADQFGGPSFLGNVSGGYSPKQAPALAALIPEWKLNAQDAGLAKAITRLERAIQPWKTEMGGMTGPAYVSMFHAQRDEIQAAIVEIESFALGD